VISVFRAVIPIRVVEALNRRNKNWLRKLEKLAQKLGKLGFVLCQMWDMEDTPTIYKERPPHGGLIRGVV
jgi:hypothetical protein